MTGRLAARAMAATCALEMQIALGAEAAAEQRHDDAHVGLGHLQRGGDAGARRVRHLRRGPDRDLVALPLRDHRPRLDRHALGRVGHVAALHDHLGAGHGGVGIALHDRVVGHRVARGDDVLVLLIGVEVGVDQRGAGSIAAT